MRQQANWTTRLRHQGVHLWHTARHYGRELDRHVHTAARLYAAIQPGLRGVLDTREVDKHLSTGYGMYNQLKANMEDGIQVVDGVAAHLRGGAHSYRWATKPFV